MDLDYKNMIAINLLTNKKINVLESNDYIRQQFPNAEYYSVTKNYTCIYERCKNISVNEIKHEFKYCYDMINNKLYKHTFTNKYKEIVRMYKKPSQLNIFDFLGG